MQLQARSQDILKRGHLTIPPTQTQTTSISRHFCLSVETLTAIMEAVDVAVIIVGKGKTVGAEKN